MILQSFVFPNEICENTGLYYDSCKHLNVENDSIVLNSSEWLDSYSYMNLFDMKIWNKYTGIKHVVFKIHLCGQCKLDIYSDTNLLTSVEMNGIQEVAMQLPLDLKNKDCFLHFKITAYEKTYFYGAEFCCEEKQRNDINLGILICTYKRKETVLSNIRILRNSNFFDKESQFFQKMEIMIIDNASELDVIEDDGIRLYHNPNTGGSGGFSRGMEEYRKDKKKVSHLLLMDDDVIFHMESLYRTYALLAYALPQYQDKMIAGRMFRLDKRNIQYSAAEIWNKGDIRHIGYNLDVTKQNQLSGINDSANAQYGGWWFACFSMKFVEKNHPIPFFIHCDDVEYGLRHGGVPIILNGIQVWHETYEYRQSPIINYYDVRNSLYVNSLHNLWKNNEELLEFWKIRMGQFHVREDYQSEFYVILAMRDYLRGMEWLNRIDTESYHNSLLQKKGKRIKNMLCWRIIWLQLKIRAYLRQGLF